MSNIKTIIAIIALSATTAGQAQTYPTQLLSHETQIDAIIKDMTLEEKIAMLHGKNMFSLGIGDWVLPIWSMLTDLSASVRRWSLTPGTPSNSPPIMRHSSRQARHSLPHGAQSGLTPMVEAWVGRQDCAERIWYWDLPSTYNAYLLADAPMSI